jgi:ubiquitin carboxyl-terminal hydrolase 9/24
MIPELRKGILLVEGAVNDEDEELVQLEEKSESESTVDTGYQSEESRDNDTETKEKDKALERREYQISVLRQIQFIFGHLAHSQLQFHVPKGFWHTFK